MNDTLARICGNCHKPYIVMLPEFLSLPGAAVIIGDALDRHQSACRRSCQHCLGKIPDDHEGRYCRQKCRDERHRQRRRETAEELLHLTTCGTPVDEALERLGWTHGAADLWARRNKRPDVAAVLRRDTAA